MSFSEGLNIRINIKKTPSCLGFLHTHQRLLGVEQQFDPKDLEYSFLIAAEVKSVFIANNKDTMHI